MEHGKVRGTSDVAPFASDVESKPPSTSPNVQCEVKASTTPNSVPSRTLKVEAPADEAFLRERFEKYGPLHSLEPSTQSPTVALVRYYDLRASSAALRGERALYARDDAARDLDEEGRIVVRVEEHLGSRELGHIFSTYGDVRNIQDVPNIEIHKVVEFYDTRAAAKAVQALNAGDTDAMHAASVTYLEKTRCKLFLIPPRLAGAAIPEEKTPSMMQSRPKTLPLGGTSKGKQGGCSYSMSRLFDSSSSLFGSAEGVARPFEMPLSSRFSLDQSSNDSSVSLSVREILPTGLGLYEDEESDDREQPTVDHAASEILTANRGSGWNPVLPSLNDGSFDGFSPLTTSLMEQLGGTPFAFPGLDVAFMSDQEQRDLHILSQYLDCYEQATIFQHAVRIEVMKRLNSLKSFVPDEGNASGDPWKSRSRAHHRKKGTRFPRRGSALDLDHEAERRAQQERMFGMDLERVRNGQDKRTTLMIKNIPNKYTQRMLLNRIEQEFKGTFDFFYLPIDFKNKCNVGYGFINMTSTEHIVAFVEHVHQQRWDKFNSDKICCVTYARIQGRPALINHFQNSSLMLEDSKHQPLLFKSDGEPEPFPV